MIYVGNSLTLSYFIELVFPRLKSGLSANEKLEYRVFNSLGQLECNSFFGNETHVNISKWSQGLYLIAVYRDNVKVFSKSVIKNN